MPRRGLSFPFGAQHVRLSSTQNSIAVWHARPAPFLPALRARGSSDLTPKFLSLFAVESLSTPFEDPRFCQVENPSALSGGGLQFQPTGGRWKSAGEAEV